MLGYKNKNLPDKIMTIQIYMKTLTTSYNGEETMYVYTYIYRIQILYTEL